LRHRFWLGVSERVGWSRGAFRETPAHRLPALTFEQSERIAALQVRYQINFERRLNAATSGNNYEYLDILDRAFSLPGMVRPVGGVVCDIGCASFWYAATLAAFFQPSELIGIEVEGHRLFKDGRARIDYASGYLADLPNARFLIADYRVCEIPADIITAWFPFLTPAAILAWRLPLSLLAPERVFARVRHNLRPGGHFFMVNHGEAEARAAEKLCVAAGLRPVARVAEAGALSGQRLLPAVASGWTRG
jgi:SAM-dependent methyltransferase